MSRVTITERTTDATMTFDPARSPDYIQDLLESVRQDLYELPDLVLKNERLNPAWSKAEIWGIERDLIPSIRALCRAAAHRLIV